MSKKLDVNIPDDPHEGRLKHLGGSASDLWNATLVQQAGCSMAIKGSDQSALDRQVGATIAGLDGIAPRDELEGMMAAQLIAAHNATMERNLTA